MKRKPKKQKQLKRPTNLKQGDLIEVHWNDHWSSPGWWRPEAALDTESEHVKSVGYFVGFNKDNMILLSGSQELEEAKQLNTLSARMWSEVTKIRKV